MLIQSVYAVYDLKAECYSTPIFAVNDAVAIRMFTSACLDPETPVGANPLDYALFRVGAWNADHGALAGTDCPLPVISGVEALKSKEIR